MKKIFKIIGIIFLIFAISAMLIYSLVLQYPKLKKIRQKENGIVWQAMR